MSRRLLVAVALAVATFGPGAASAQTIGPTVSINIVEPKDQSKWGYAPGTRKIAPGTWVTWSNNGQDDHTVTADDGSFDSSDLEPSDGFSWYFDQPGIYHYTCTLHPWMAGTIVVGSGQPSGVSSQPAVSSDQPSVDETAVPVDETSSSDGD
jgi:plastocyanin